MPVRKRDIARKIITGQFTEAGKLMDLRKEKPLVEPALGQDQQRRLSAVADNFTDLNVAAEQQAIKDTKDAIETAKLLRKHIFALEMELQEKQQLKEAAEKSGSTTTIKEIKEQIKYIEKNIKTSQSQLTQALLESGKQLTGRLQNYNISPHLNNLQYAFNLIEHAPYIKKDASTTFKRTVDLLVHDLKILAATENPKLAQEKVSSIIKSLILLDPLVEKLEEEAKDRKFSPSPTPATKNAFNIINSFMSDLIEKKLPKQYPKKLPENIPGERTGQFARQRRDTVINHYPPPQAAPTAAANDNNHTGTTSPIVKKWMNGG